MKTLQDESCRSEILRRVRSLSVDSPRQWGKMTVGQMVCHLTDCFRFPTGDLTVEGINTLWGRTGLKWIALYLPLQWPKNAPTAPEVDPHRYGTQPTEFATDLGRLESVIGLFLEAVSQNRCSPHPIFGAMSDNEWFRWGYLHADHHLRQFGV